MSIKQGNNYIAGGGSSGSVSIDNLSITQNSSLQIQAIGVIDSNNTTNAIKTWTGTKAQYDAIVTKDANTLYNITDDTDVSLTILEALYPVGSVYITTASTCPLSTLISGSTWTLVSSGRVLQGADNDHSAGTTISAGLPDHTHHIANQNAGGSATGGGYIPASSFDVGSVIVNSGTNGESGNGNWTDRSGTGFSTNRQQMTNASTENPIYGNSNTVQPPAYVVNIFERTA